jgi:hypothetical protein
MLLTIGVMFLENNAIWQLRLGFDRWEFGNRCQFSVVHPLVSVSKAAPDRKHRQQTCCERGRGAAATANRNRLGGGASYGDRLACTQHLITTITARPSARASRTASPTGFFAYVGKRAKGDYIPFLFGQPLMTGDIELTEPMFLVEKDLAEAYQKAKAQPPQPKPEVKPEPGKEPEKQPPEGLSRRIRNNSPSPVWLGVERFPPEVDEFPYHVVAAGIAAPPTLKSGRSIALP